MAIPQSETVGWLVVVASVSVIAASQVMLYRILSRMTSVLAVSHDKSSKKGDDDVSFEELRAQILKLTKAIDTNTMSKPVQIGEITLCTSDHIYEDVDCKQIAHRFIPAAEENPLEDIEEFNDRDTRDEAEHKLFANLSLMSKLMKEARDKLQGFNVEETRIFEEYSQRWGSRSSAEEAGGHKVAT